LGAFVSDLHSVLVEKASRLSMADWNWTGSRALT
jgi:hypothetical protein